MLTPCAFPKQNRLLNASDYRWAFAKSQKIGTRHWTVIVRFDSGLSEPKLGLVIAKKQASKAVDRNRLKRLCRERFRQTKQALPPCSLVVLAKSGTRLQNNKVLSGELTAIFRKLVPRQYNAANHSESLEKSLNVLNRGGRNTKTAVALRSLSGAEGSDHSRP